MTSGSSRSTFAWSASAVSLFAALIACNVGAWIIALVVCNGRPALMGAAALAWVFGLRHAVDADHIAAIDNAVRKLMQQRKRAVTTGLYFSLGHSSVVFVAVLALAATAASLESQGAIRNYVGGIGATVSAVFLLLIAVINLFILRAAWRSFRDARGGAGDRPIADEAFISGGLIGRIVRPLFRVVNKSWHMYPVGVLFGLGFDTATEIGLLSISATEAARGVSLSHVLVFPALFAAGMALVDTADSALMAGAYRWAFADPLRKLWYNLTITGASILVALFIGGVEALGLIGSRLGLDRGPWMLVESLNASLGNLGFAVIALFVIAWLVSIGVYRVSFAGRSEPVALDRVDAAEMA